LTAVVIGPRSIPPDEWFVDLLGERGRIATAFGQTLAAITAIVGREDGERHLEARVGNVETTAGGRQVFAAVAKADTDIAGLIRRDLENVGQTDETVVTAFTDGRPGLRCILVDAGVTKPPILDWFHIAMRMQHAAQAASG
jgi:hypothetical protein